jgi:hypothetical protein
MIHWLKTDQPFFDAIWDGDKTFEIRKNDRNFAEGDLLILGEGIGILGEGKSVLRHPSAPRAVIARVTHVLDKMHCFEGVHLDYVAMGLHYLGRFCPDDLTLFEYTTAKVTSRQWTRFERREPKEAS